MSSAGGHHADGAVWERRMVDRIAAGDDGALADVYDRYSSLVFGLALRVTCDRGVAEDVTQDVFVNLWKRPDRFDAGRGSLRSLLAAMARNRAIDIVRSRSASQRREDNEGHLATVPVMDVVDDVIRRDVSDTVRRALEQLPIDQRDAIALAYFGGHTYREVAQMLGIPEGTAKSRLRIGLQRLGALLHDEGVTA